MFDPLLTLNHYRRVLTLAGSHKNRVQSKCLFRFDDPVSPHLAARRANASSTVEVCAMRIYTRKAV